MKLKLDEAGHAVLQDGKPIYIHDDGKEVPFDAAGTVATITRINGEAKSHRERAEAATTALKAFEGITDPAAAIKALQHDFIDANVNIFASSHTCLPAIKTVPMINDAGRDVAGVIVNNGSAGMANFRDTTHGLITRISSRPFAQGGAATLSQSATRAGDLYIDLLRVDFDSAAWTQMFLSNWPEGSAAHASYFKRITRGPAFAGNTVL